MKFLSLSILVLLNIYNVQSQENYSYKDQEFQSIYKQIALRAGQRQLNGEKLIAKWDSDIKVFAETGITREMKEELQKTFDTVAPLLGKIKIEWVTDKRLSSFVIKCDSIEKTGEYMHWDGLGTIYKAHININKTEVFNVEEQNKKVQHLFLRALGHFSFQELKKNGGKIVKCNLALWRSAINPFDKEVIKFHYSDGIKSGMNEKDLDAYLKKVRKE